MKNCLLLLLAALCLASPLSRADEAPAEDLYLKAMQAVAEGREGDANEILRQMLQGEPRNAGEWLDLAMVQCTLGHDSEAERLFSHIEVEFAPEQGILNLINDQRRQGCRSVIKPLRQWSVSVARGNDSNVNQGASNPYYVIGGGTPLELLPEYRPRGDHYTSLSGDYMGNIGQNGDIGFVQLHVRQHDALSDYNTASLFAGAEHPWRLQRWRMRSSALLGLLTLGGRLYQEQAQVQLQALPPLKLPYKLELKLIGSLSRINYKTLSNFNATTVDLRTALSYHGDNTDAQLSTGFLFDQGPSARPGGDRSGWSTRLYSQTQLGSALLGELDLSQQRWNGRDVYSPGLIDETRRQSTSAVRATLIYPLSREQEVHLEWRAVRNRENISLFQYSSRQLQLSWHWYAR